MPFLFAAGRSVKWNENALALRRRNTFAVIPDPEDHVIPFGASGQLDRRAGGRVPERVVNEVTEYTQRVNEIEPAEGQRRRIIERNPEAITVRPAGDVLHDERHSAAVYATDLKEIRNQPVKSVSLLFDEQCPLVAERLHLVGEGLDR